MFVGLFFLSGGSSWGMLKSGSNALYINAEKGAINVILGAAGSGLLSMFAPKHWTHYNND